MRSRKRYLRPNAGLLPTALILLSGLPLFLCPPVYAIEEDDVYVPVEPGVPFDPTQRIHVAEPADGAILTEPPQRITVFFRRFDFDLNPSTLELWIDGMEHTEALRFWVDRAWLDLPPGFMWSPGMHTVVARVAGLSGFHADTSVSDFTAPSQPMYPWPFSGTNQPDVVSNLMEDYQSFSTIIWHYGLDIRSEMPAPVKAVVGGTVVKRVNYDKYENNDPKYWSFMIEDPDGFIWQYHHMDSTTIAFDEGQAVNQGDEVGTIVSWPQAGKINGERYHHLHLNVAKWTKNDPLPKPYRDGYAYLNPLLFLDYQASADSLFPFLGDVWFTENEKDTAFASFSDVATPILSGDVDIIARLTDYRTELPGIPGQPYRLGIYDLAYSVEPVDPGCGYPHVPKTTLARFTQVPNVPNINTQIEDLLEVYKEDLHYDGTNYSTIFNYNAQNFFYTLTNTSLGHITGLFGYWDTDQATYLGPTFPDGDYVVKTYARDFHGNTRITSIPVTLNNGLLPNCFSPFSIVGGSITGNFVLESSTGPIAQTPLGSFPLAFEPFDADGSVRGSVDADDWPPMHFDVPAEGIRIAIGVLQGHQVEVEYVPYLGDVILEVPAEVQVYPLPIGGEPPVFDPTAAPMNALDLRLSTRLARHPWTGASLIGVPQAPNEFAFTLVMAEAVAGLSQPIVLRTEAGGAGAEWSLNSGVDPPRPAIDATMIAFPNPFATQLATRVSLARRGQVEVRVFDLQGQLVRRLHHGTLAEGMHEFTWDGLDAGGRRAPAGVYFLHTQTPDGTATRKVVRLR